MQKRFLLPSVVLLAVALALPATAQVARPLAADTFPTESHDLFLSSATATVAGIPGVLTLVDSVPAASGPTAQAGFDTQLFLLPGVSALGVINQPDRQSWYGTEGWDKEREIVDDAVVQLYFSANAQVLAVFEVQLLDVEPNGDAHVVARDTQQFVTALDDAPVDFQLVLAGAVVKQGHFLRLQVIAQTANAAVILQYGGDSPSGLLGLQTRWLDTDGDGVADSDEIVAGSNPLDADQREDLARDTDGDGIPDAVEATLGTDPNKVDTDGDGFGDGVEHHAGTDPLDADSKPGDRNGDGLPDSFESRYFDNRVYNNTTYTVGGPGTGALDDPDEDGCNNLCEAAHGTDPLNPDSDGDGISDGDEVAAGTDPGKGAAFGAASQSIPEPVAAAGLFAGAATLALVALFRRP